REYLTLEEYKAATAAGTVTGYSGTKYKSVDARYADGWAYNAVSKRWIKTARQQDKAAMKSCTILTARVEEIREQMREKMQAMADLAAEGKKLQERVILLKPTAPKLVVFDTNWLIHNLHDVKCRVRDIAERRPDTSILLPKEVVQELDRKK
ncbi:unnamed protein product, partial [Choristocarpus tenellus]